MMYKLLIVEDEEVIRSGLKHLIGQLSQDFTVSGEAVHGKEALHILESGLVDAVITDIRMREMDGLTLIVKIRERYASMPIVVVSGYSEFEYARQALKNGVTDYLLKPIDRTALISALFRIKESLDDQCRAAPGSAQLLAPQPQEAEQPSDQRRIIRKIKEYVTAHPDGDLRLQVLAGLVHLNSAYLSQLFKSETGLNFSDYVTEIRIERAKHLLKTTNLKIYDIARLSGYQSPKHFMLVFKQQTGVPPGLYRERQTDGAS